jgi:hypothetical protein
MKDSGKSTHRGRAVDPTCFREIATGIGQTLAGSERTGGQRNLRVRETAGNRGTFNLAPVDEGFTPDPDDMMAVGLAPMEPPVDSEYEPRTWRR